MQPNSKKEVSCKALEPIFQYARLKNVELNLLLEGVAYEPSYLLNKHERIEWWVYCKIIANSRACFSSIDFENMGVNFIKRESYFEAVLLAFFFFTSNKFIKLLYKKLFQLGSSMFTCLKGDIESLGPNRIKAIVYLEEGYDFCPELFFITKGVWEQLGKEIGQKGIKVDLNVTPEKTVMNVTWNKEDFLIKIKRSISWLFNLRKALVAFTDSHQELVNQYEKLEQSRNLLFKQTTQLKTAHEISTSIRQSLDINDTLQTIVEILIKEAGFSSASIHLLKDMEDKNIDIKIQAGEKTKLISKLQKELIINEKIIGEMVVYPKPGVDYREVDELLKHLFPVINIAIHDALVLRTITDYKDNLEQKVANRTVELQKARDQLADTNMLLKESQQIQNHFFANISHEFRTPLTLILGPAKQLLQGSKDEGTKSAADLIHRSAKKLNRLVDELLDISKIESGEMKLNAHEENVVSLVKEIALSFYPLAERKKIDFKFISDEDEIIAFMDKNKFEKILNNVLSNAFKFTPEGGTVEIEIKASAKSPPKEGTFQPKADKPLVYKSVSSPPMEGRGVGSNGFAIISIRDTGIGIPKDQLDKIFDRFYQIDGSHTREQEGTGIGLALTKELINLHKGKIEVESEESKGSIFKLIFPLGRDHLNPNEICEREQDKDYDKALTNAEFEDFIAIKNENRTDIESVVKPALPTLQIVEDNSDVRKYIKTILEHHYQILEAKDGEEGLNKAFDSTSGGPDLIITDVMMPKLDGFQLCSKLKADSRTSHIPIIMLTAKATIHDKIEGLETGADDYIMKPFEADELKARIKNLLEQRNRLHEHFRKQGLINIEDKNITSVDKQFLQKAVSIINEHISDTLFGVEVLAEDMAVSRSLLLKKTEALIGESPNELIRRIRLEKAANLLKHNSGNISEIALKVGFSNPSYFAEAFKKQFGVSPSQYHSKS